MSIQSTAVHDRMRTVSRAILGVGLAAALLIFLSAPATLDRENDDLQETKASQRDLEIYGGAANVLAADVRTWFASLWYGRRLAYTVAAVTVALTTGYRFLATPSLGDNRATNQNIEPAADTDATPGSQPC